MEYKMGLQSKYFNLIRKSEKTVEARLNDAKRQKLKVGDIIEFCEEPDRDNKIDTIVVELDKYNSFSDAIDDKGIKPVGRIRCNHSCTYHFIIRILFFQSNQLLDSL